MNRKDILKKLAEGKTLSADEIKFLSDTEPVSDEAAVQKQLDEMLSKAVAGIKEDSDKKLAEKFEAWKKEQDELAAKRAGLQNTDVKSKRAALNERTRKFVTALISNDVAVLKDMSTTDNKGGYTIDSELNAEIQHIVTNYGVARRNMTVVTLSKGDLKMNNLATDLSVYWTDEAAAKTSSDVVLGQVTLALKKLAVIVPMTEELLEDSEIDLVGFLTARIAEGMAEKEDAAFFTGDGSAGFGSFTGLLNDANINVVTMGGTTFAGVTADDLLDMQDATPAGVLANCKYYMHRSIMSLVRTLKSNDGHYIYQPPAEAGPSTIWGYPVELVEVMPDQSDTAADTAFVLFGDLRKACWLGTKGGLTVKVADQAVVRNTANNADINTFRQDMVALRVVERVGYVVVLPTAVTVLKTAEASA